MQPDDGETADAGIASNDHAGRDDPPSATRRSVLQAAAVGVAGLGIGSSVLGSAGAAAIPTPPLVRCGNELRDPTGQSVILRGVNVADPGRQLRPWRGQTAEETVALALDDGATPPERTRAARAGAEGWHTDVVRLPVQPQDVYAGTDNTGRSVMPHGDDWGPVLPDEAGDSPAPITAATLEEYFGEIVDPLVDMCEQRGAYVLIDYHRHFPVFHQVQYDWDQLDYPCGDSPTEHDRGGCGERGVLWHGADQAEAVVDAAPDAVASSVDSVYTEPTAVAEALRDEVERFWAFVADEYADRDHVLFSLYNEPGGPYLGAWGGPERMPVSIGWETESGDPPDLAHESHEVFWDLWEERAQPWVDVVEEHAPGSVAVVGSPRWSQYTHHAGTTGEFDADSLQLCYDLHAHMQDSLRPFDEYFGPPAEQVPVVVGEFGWAKDGGMDDFDVFTFGPQEDPWADFESFFEAYPVHPIASRFDHTWEPAFFRGRSAEDGGAPDKGEDETWMDYVEPYRDAAGQWWMTYLHEKAGRDDPTDGSSPADCLRYSPSASTTTTTEPTTTTTTTASTPGRVGSNTALPSDPDGDGLYEDVNGNTRRDIADAVDLFRNRDSVDARYFDFNDGGGVSIGDAVSLFRENA